CAVRSAPGRPWRRTHAPAEPRRSRLHASSRPLTSDQVRLSLQHFIAIVKRRDQKVTDHRPSAFFAAPFQQISPPRYRRPSLQRFADFMSLRCPAGTHPHAWATRTPHPWTLVPPIPGDRKSTRLNSSHVSISYAVFCFKK